MTHTARKFTTTHRSNGHCTLVVELDGDQLTIDTLRLTIEEMVDDFDVEDYDEEEMVEFPDLDDSLHNVPTANHSCSSCAHFSQSAYEPPCSHCIRIAGLGSPYSKSDEWEPKEGRDCTNCHHTDVDVDELPCRFCNLRIDGGLIFWMPKQEDRT